MKYGHMYYVTIAFSSKRTHKPSFRQELTHPTKHINTPQYFTYMQTIKIKIKTQTLRLIKQIKMWNFPSILCDTLTPLTCFHRFKLQFPLRYHYRNLGQMQKQQFQYCKTLKVKSLINIATMIAVANSNLKTTVKPYSFPFHIIRSQLLP